MKVLTLSLKATIASMMVAGIASTGYAADLDTEVAEPVVEKKDSIFTRDNFFGDPLGFREKLRDNGLNTTVFYVNQAAAAVAGGTNSGLGYSDMFFFGFDYDLEKSPLKIKGGSLHLTFTNRNGDNVAADSGIGTNLLVNEVFGQGNIWRLNHLFYEQKLFDNKVVLKGGRVNGSFDFFPFSCNFQNLTFCSAIPSYITPNYTPFPGHTWGGIVTLNPTDNFYVKGGIFEINSQFDSEDNALVIEPIGEGQGARTNFEAGYTANIKGLKGTYRAGVFFDNVGSSNLGGLGDGLVEDDSLFGWYFLFEQELWKGKNGRGITLFGSHTQGDADVAALDQVTEIGAFVQGPLKFRPQDELGIAFGRIGNNSLVTSFDLANNPGEVRRQEFPFEIYYAAKVLPSLTIQPNFQYIINPGGVSTRDNAAVVGVKTVVVF